MSVHEAAKAHFQEKRGGLLYVEAPELSKEDFPEQRVYYYKLFPGRDMVHLYPLVVAQSYSLLFEAFARAARNADGTPIFTDVNTHQVYEDWDPDLVSRLVKEMGVLKSLGVDLEIESKKD